MKNHGNTKHGLKNSRFYNIWKCAKSRCHNPNNHGYYKYGAIGITFDQHWHKFENFRDDMYQSYLDHVQKFGEKDTSLDRKNVLKGYSKSNCSWATLLEQGRNKRNTLLIKFRGRSMILSDWAVELGIGYQTLYQRIYFQKLTLERAFNKKRISRSE